MTMIQAIISGIVQGITEFLPVSSSGHLVILHRLFGIEEPQIGFDIFLHMGTLLAIFLVFWRDIVDAVTVKKKMFFLVLLGTFSTLIFILIFGKNIEAAFSNPKLVGAMLIVTGSWLILGSFVRFGTQGASGVKAILIGLAQGVAAIPGISRSGATISTALFLGFEPQSAARFSFLLAIPAILGAFLFKIKSGGAFEGFSINYIFGFITACIFGVIALKLLLRMLLKNRFHLFGVYCIVVGILVLLVM